MNNIIFYNGNDNIEKDTTIAIPLTINATIKLNKIICNKFCPNNDLLEMFNNKRAFQEFMILYFPFNIPEPVFNIDDYPYLIKPIYGCGGNRIEYITIENNKTFNIKDFIMERYIHNNNYYVGQYMVLNGKILWHCTYKTNIDKNTITIIRGKIKNYTIVEHEDNLFNEIFKICNYTGFACIDFTILNDIVKIFEINPRVGGTFMDDEKNVFNALFILSKYIE